MKALVLTSTSFRHRYFALEIAKYFDGAAVLTEEKRNYYTAQRTQSKAIQHHFEQIAAAENEWFAGVKECSSPPTKTVADINSHDCISWAQDQNIDVVCLFGTAILGQAWLDAFSSRIVNLHLGLSPFYRGSATLFWPFVHRELEYLGTTIHLATAKVDAGNIIARIDADLRPKEGYYAITSRLVRDSIRRFPSAIDDFFSGKVPSQPQEFIAGRLCRKSDFNEDALIRALEYGGGGLSVNEIERIEVAKACRY